MSVAARYEMWCNGTVQPHGHPCMKTYEPPEGTSWFVPLAELRALAAKDGWTYVPARVGGRARPRLGSDLCPDHSGEAR